MADNLHELSEESWKMPRYCRWMLFIVICLGSPAWPVWGAVYRCPDAQGRLVFSDTPCAGAELVQEDTPASRAETPEAAPSQSDDQRPARRGPVSRSSQSVSQSLLPEASPHSAQPGAQAFDPTKDLGYQAWKQEGFYKPASPERGQRLCERKPELCLQWEANQARCNRLIRSGLSGGAYGLLCR
jgi:hypothetical protein